MTFWEPYFSMRERAFYEAFGEFGLTDCEHGEAFRIQQDQNRGKRQMIEQLKSRASLEQNHASAPTTVSIPRERIAKRALDVLLDRINTSDSHRRTTRQTGKCLRASSAGAEVNYVGITSF